MSFYRTAVYLSIGLIIFSAGITFISGLDVFPTGMEETSVITGLDANLDWAWGTIVTFGTLFSLLICILLRSAVPLGINIFGVIFWTSWVHASAILSFGGFIPGEFILLFTIGVGFIFAAAVIGMLTGSG